MAGRKKGGTPWKGVPPGCLLFGLHLIQVFLQNLGDEVGHGTALPFSLGLQPGFELAGGAKADLSICFIQSPHLPSVIHYIALYNKQLTNFVELC